MEAFEPKVEMESEYEEEDPEMRDSKRQMGEPDLRLYYIRRTLLQMLRDRGYLVGDAEIAMSKEGFQEKFGNDIMRSSFNEERVKRDNRNEKISVFFPDEEKIRLAAIKQYAEIMKKKNIKLAILVIKQTLTIQGKQAISEMSSKHKYKIDVFQDTELLVNVKDSIFVPEHHVLTEYEKERILERFSAKLTQLPRLLVEDPIARYYGLTKGQMVEIVRPGDAAGGEEAMSSYRQLV